MKDEIHFCYNDEGAAYLQQSVAIHLNLKVCIKNVLKIFLFKNVNYNDYHQRKKTCSFINILAKGPPKRFNSATFRMKIYWPKMMLERCPKIQIDTLIPHLLIYAPKNRILIS